MGKGKLNATIDSGLLNLFDKHCEDEDKNRSAVLERMIRQYLEDKNIIKKERVK